MLRRVAMLLLVLLVIAPLASGQAIDQQFLITAGVGVGPIGLGTLVTEVVTALGMPKSTLPATSDDPAVVIPATESKKPGGLTSYAWFDYAALLGNRGQYAPGSSGPNGGLLAYATNLGKIVIVQVVYAPQYATAQGLHVGVSEQEVRNLMAAPASVAQGPGFHSLVYSAQGIVFMIVDEPHAAGYRTVYSIVVFAPH